MTEAEIEKKTRERVEAYFLKHKYAHDNRNGKQSKIHEMIYLDGLVEGSKTVDLELIHIINDIVKYHDDEETKKNEYETAVLKLARYWEKLGKVELAEWTLAQIGINAWIPQ